VTGSAPPFDLLTRLFGDPEMAELLSERATIQRWLDAERALAEAQAQLGVLTEAQAQQIAASADADSIDADALWRDARNVGYPILPLVRQLNAAVPREAAGRVHFGATTQDIMDTALALALRDALDRLQALVERFGSALAGHAAEHRDTVMAGRTHGQQAVPTTLGAKLAIFLSELARHRERLSEARPRIARVSLHGAAGTSAALGPRAGEIRALMAARLGLGAEPVPWHVARDGVAEFSTTLCGMLASTCARFAREVIDLARTEIGELDEGGGHHRGASSTMPQKANPVRSEAVVGMAAVAQALSAAALRAMEAGHERSAGEWQIEWFTVPALAGLTAGCLRVSAEVAEGLRVHGPAMARNMKLDGGLIMAEAHMIRLAATLGRESAHDLVYAAAQQARSTGRPLADVLAEAAPGAPGIEPHDYLGEAAAVCDAALSQWASPPLLRAT
jgi:3-carboxy-cis,cis-muconate cycloisomerase